jgi:hypothetical protein
MDFDTVNIIWKLLHSRCQCYCSLNEVCYSEHYVEGTSQQVYSVIAARMKCVTVNIMWKIFHNRWRVLLRVEEIVLH